MNRYWAMSDRVAAEGRYVLVLLAVAGLGITWICQQLPMRMGAF